MGYITISSGLTLQIPTAGTKNWGETFKTQFAQKISEHDHTGSGKGLQITTNALADEAVTNDKIAENTIAVSKLGDIATDRILGRDTAGDGEVELITATNGLAFTGSGGLGLANFSSGQSYTPTITARDGSYNVISTTHSLIEAIGYRNGLAGFLSIAANAITWSGSATWITVSFPAGWNGINGASGTKLNLNSCTGITASPAMEVLIAGGGSGGVQELKIRPAAGGTFTHSGSGASLRFTDFVPLS